MGREAPKSARVVANIKTSGAASAAKNTCMAPDLLTTATDAVLVRAIAQGHEPALAEVFRRHAPAVSGLARRLLGEGALAEDVTQDIFVRLWREPDRFDPDRGKLRTLLMTQAHGRAVDIVRSHESRQRREERVGRDLYAPAADVDAELMALTQAEQVKKALDSIPPAERTAIELAYFGGHTYRQVAVILDLPEGTVKARIRTGLRRLHALLTSVGDDDEHSTVSNPPAVGRAGRSEDRSDAEDKPWDKPGRET